MKTLVRAFTVVMISGCAEVPAEVAEEESTEFRGFYDSSPPRLIRNNKKFPNSEGYAATFSDAGVVNLKNPFTKDFGTNGRTCITCHAPEDGWTISPPLIQEQFEDTEGMHPLFRLVDGANSPVADVSTLEARRAAYSLLLSRGVIRVGIGIPDNAQFELVAVDDPYGYASAAELSLFRRPLPSANLSFMATVMWDGRETASTLETGLANQANGATLGHAEALMPLTTSQRNRIVDFELGLSHAQIRDNVAGDLSRRGARGGPEELANLDPENAPFNLFEAWANDNRRYSAEARRASIARGEALFNSPTPGSGSCRGCHNVANVGTNLNGTFFDVQVSAAARRDPAVPLYTLRNLETGEERSTTDPGRALITGLWTDVDRFKVPSLRGLAARAPYFHDGSSETLLDVVRHYETAQGFVFTADEEEDLVAFLSAL